MANFDLKVTDYIAKCEDFAQPILEHWRKLMHENCPDMVEAIKYGIPHFDYKGDYMCVMAAYKSHCSFTFLKAPLMNDPRLKDSKDLKPIQRFLGKITKLSDLPNDAEFVSFIKETMVLNEKGMKVIAQKSDEPKPAVEMPDYFVEKLATNPKAHEVFYSKSPSFRKEYILWIVDAKTEETRQKRMEEALVKIEAGVGRFLKMG